MVQARHKVREHKRKTVFDKLKNSALFLLLVVLVIILDVVYFIFWLSGLLSGSLEGLRIFTDHTFIVTVATSLALAAFFGTAYVVQRRVHGA